MKKSTWIILVVVFCALLVVGWFMGAYNKMVGFEEGVNNSWAQVESAYQRRSDLIPNLVSTVKGYASHENETFVAVTQARALAENAGSQLAEEGLSSESLTQYQKAQEGVTSALSRLIAIREAYPELKADKTFLELQAQLEGTENRINVARNYFNSQVNIYNTTIRRFPTNIVASMFGFEKKAYFEADENASQAPVVDFSK